jgi:hypothetical protein
MSLDHVRPDALSAEQRAAWRAYILDAALEERVRELAAQLWSDAIDREQYDAADRIAAETDTWFEPEAEQ